MLALYPDHINPGSLWGDANAATLTRRADGKVVAIDGRHSPQAAAATLAMALKTKLAVSLTPDPFI
jgi:hypothetical protein